MAKLLPEEFLLFTIVDNIGPCQKNIGPCNEKSHKIFSQYNQKYWIVWESGEDGFILCGFKMQLFFIVCKTNHHCKKLQPSLKEQNVNFGSWYFHVIYFEAFFPSMLSNVQFVKVISCLRTYLWTVWCWTGLDETTVC